MMLKKHVQTDTPNAQKCQIRLRFISILSILWWVSNEVGGLLGLGEIHQIDFNTHFKEYILRIESSLQSKAWKLHFLGNWTSNWIRTADDFSASDIIHAHVSGSDTPTCCFTSNPHHWALVGNSEHPLESWM